MTKAESLNFPSQDRRKGRLYLVKHEKRNKAVGLSPPNNNRSSSSNINNSINNSAEDSLKSGVQFVS